MLSTRRNFLKTAALGLAAASIPTITTSCAGRKRPNILYIMSDDHGEQAISCYGSKLIETPNIDRIAKSGMRFENSFVTNSLCAPSRAVLFTGKYSHLNGLRDNRDTFDGSQQTFPKLLQKAGYQTGMFGKWHLKTDPTGFDQWKILIDQGEYYNPVFIENGTEKQYTGYTTDLITDMAIAELEARDPEKPFCFFVHHKAPHRNWMPAPRYFHAYDDRKLPLPETFYDDYEGRPAAKEADMRIENMYLSHDLKLNKGYYKKETGTGGNAEFAQNAVKNWEAIRNRMTEEQLKTWDEYYDKINQEYKDANLSGDELLRWKYQRYMQDYLECILAVDDSVGKLLDYLEDKGLAKDTVVVYTSDQGFYLGEHGWYDKRFMYEESLSMPLLMQYPRLIPAETVNTDLVMNLDFAPTFLDLAGVQVPEDMQGMPMRPLFKGNDANWRKSIYYHYYEYPHGWHMVHKHYGVRTDRYKLIHFYGELDEWELYDLETDPHEIHNLFGKDGYDEITADLKAELQRLKEMYKDPVS